MGDVGAGRADRSLQGLGKDAVVLMHQSTVHKDQRLCQGPEDFYLPCLLPLDIKMP